MPGGPSLPTLDYHAMRLRWCAQALKAFLRRWGAYFVVAGLVASAGTSTPVAVLSALAAWLVVPLFKASTWGAWIVPATLAQAAFGAALVWGARNLLWSEAWAEAERALPLRPAQRVRSDVWVVGLALAPLALLYGAGTVSVLAQHPAWLQPTLVQALAALALALAGSLGLGVALLQWRRRAPRPSMRGRRRTIGLRGDAGSRPRSSHWAVALLLKALWRGPARRTVAVLAIGTFAIGLPGLGAWAWPAATPWWLALLALLVLSAVTRAHLLSRVELDPLVEACRVLPLSLPALREARRWLCLLPLLPAGITIAVGLASGPGRTAVLAAYGVVLAGSCVWELHSAPAQPSDKAARWLFSLVLCLVLAAEVMP